MLAAQKNSVTLDTRMSMKVAIVLLIWLAIALSIASTGVLVTDAGQTPLPIALSVSLPIILFAFLYQASPAFQHWLLHAPAALITALMAWRFAGLGFLGLYAYHVLPAMFALPAGLGDLAIGIMAPWLAMHLMRNPSYVANKFFIAWNWLGIFDLAVAVSMGALGSLLATGAPGEITTRAMALLPLSVIPTFLVPLMVMLHATVLLQARHFQC